MTATGTLPATAEAGRIVACEQAILRFTAALDAADAADMKRHFAVDGMWYRPSGVVEGHAGIDEFVAALPADTVMRHIVTNTRALSVTDTEVELESYFTVYIRAAADRGSEISPNAVGRYRDRLVRIGDAWIITERTVCFDIT